MTLALSDWFRPAKSPVVAAAPSMPRSDLPAPSGRGSYGVREAWTVWRRVGEVHYATTQQARLLGRIGWRLRLTPESDPLDADQSEAALHEAFGGRIRELVKLAAIHLQVAGGFYLARMSAGDASSWEIVPYPADYADTRRLKEADAVALCLNRDPLDVDRADSPVLAALDVAQELMLARAQSRAHARSRTAQLNTLLYPLEGVPDTDAFEAALVDVMAAPLSDERSAASVVPNLIGFPAEYIDRWRTMDLAGADDKELADRIERLIRQLALQLDIPPELMTGISGLNHWSAWLLQEDNWLGHIEPMAHPIGLTLADALGQAAGVEGVSIEPDPSRLMQRRPTVDHALTAYTYGLVDAQWTREQLGASDEDAPDSLPELPITRRAVRYPASGEPAVTAAIRLPDAGRLVDVDAELYEFVESWLAKVVDAVLSFIGATLHSDDMPDDLDDTGAAVWYARNIGDLPGLDAAIEAVTQDHSPELVEELDRAVEAINAAGADLDTWSADVLDMLPAAVGALLAAYVADQAVKATSWHRSRAAVSVAGGGTDPGVSRVGPMLTVGFGLALGVYVLSRLRARGIAADEWVWLHRAPRVPHPQHLALDRKRFDGSAIVVDGVLWYPGDHAGCQCGAAPVFEYQRGVR